MQAVTMDRNLEDLVSALADEEEEEEDVNDDSGDIRPGATSGTKVKLAEVLAELRSVHHKIELEVRGTHGKIDDLCDRFEHFEVRHDGRAEKTEERLRLAEIELARLREAHANAIAEAAKRDRNSLAVGVGGGGIGSVALLLELIQRLGSGP